MPSVPAPLSGPRPDPSAAHWSEGGWGHSQGPVPKPSCATQLSWLT